MRDKSFVEFIGIPLPPLSLRVSQVREGLHELLWDASPASQVAAWVLQTEGRAKVFVMALAILILAFDFLRAFIPRFKWSKAIYPDEGPWTMQLYGVGWLRFAVAYTKIRCDKTRLFDNRA